jgi:hypothetical protein
MKPHDLVIGLLAGTVAILFGLVPGLAEHLCEGVRNFRDAVLFGIPTPARPHRLAKEVKQPVWLAGFGALIVAFTVFAYFLD